MHLSEREWMSMFDSAVPYCISGSVKQILNNLIVCNTVNVFGHLRSYFRGCFCQSSSITIAERN
jgi:hypothetical protein